MKTSIKIMAILLILFSITGLCAKATVKISVSPDSLNPGEQGKIKAVITIPAQMHQSYFPGDEEYFYLKASAKGLSFGKTQYPTPQKKEEGNEWIYAGTVTLTLPFTVNKAATGGKVNIEAEVGYNICLDSGACEAPESVNKTLNFEIIGAVNPDTPVSSDETTIDDSAAVVAVNDVEPSAEGSKSTATNVWKFLMMAFLGGVILNIMPCVLPVLSIKAMSIVKQAHEDKKVIMRHSFAYTGGILVSFLILATVIVILKLAGESVGWGFQFQNTAFVLALTSMIFVFSLSLFDVFIITPPGMNKATQASAKGGFSGSFFSGIFAVLLATPCSAPMLGTALGFAFSQTPLLIFFFFILIGLGLALPFILLGFNPKMMKVIPKPGEWMNIFKEVMGFLLLGTTVWLLHVVYQQNGGGYLLNVLIYLVFLGFATWLYGRFVRLEHSRITQWIFTILAVIVITGAVIVFLPYSDATTQQTTENAVIEEGFEGWKKFSPALVDELIAKQEPVFIDFGAKWCMTCLSNEKTVIKTDEIKKAFADKKVSLIRGDFTKKNPEMQEFMKKFGRAGVPFYVLYVPGKEPVLFPEIITIPMLKKALEQLP